MICIKFTTFGRLLILAAGIVFAAPALGQVECEDHVYATASRDTITFLHTGAYYNCCVVIETAIEYPEPFTIDLLESETYPQGPCFCMCCIDVTTVAAGFAPGLYAVRFWNADRTVLFGETEVEVVADGGGAPLVLNKEQSDCYSAVSVPGRPAAMPTWKAEKSSRTWSTSCRTSAPASSGK